MELFKNSRYFGLCLVLRQATNLITKRELLTMDPDTDDEQLVYEITAEPKHGFLESKQKPGDPVTTFTQGTGSRRLCVHSRLTRAAARVALSVQTLDLFT